MKTVIIEDEKAAVRNLTVLLEEVAPEVEIVATLDSIKETVEWFDSHSLPDLVFLDIHLADGSAFEIFERTKINCPVIFTTAYDEYALQAFEVNSVDYLLKPIGEENIRRALAKLNVLQSGGVKSSLPPDVYSLLRALKQEENYRTHFLVPQKGDKLLPLSVDRILFFYISDGGVRAVVADGSEYSFSQTLDELSECIHPGLFFRVNRQYLISRKAVKDIDLWFNSRLSVNLVLPVSEKIVVSKTKVTDFKDWFGRG